MPLSIFGRGYFFEVINIGWISEYKESVKAFLEHDPAAKSGLEIVFLYPGFKALRSHKRAQWFLNHNMPFIARAISQRCAHKTGIEIHPGAQIGKRADLGVVCDLGLFAAAANHKQIISHTRA